MKRFKDKQAPFMHYYVLLTRIRDRLKAERLMATEFP